MTRVGSQRHSKKKKKKKTKAKVCDIQKDYRTLPSHIDSTCFVIAAEYGDSHVTVISIACVL